MKKLFQPIYYGFLFISNSTIYFPFCNLQYSFCNDWGKTGHRIVGEIAERQLTDEVKEIVYDILDGESLSSVSTWPDEMRSNVNFKDMINGIMLIYLLIKNILKLHMMEII
jgi:hypothetical protein